MRAAVRAMRCPPFKLHGTRTLVPWTPSRSPYKGAAAHTAARTLPQRQVATHNTFALAGRPNTPVCVQQRARSRCAFSSPLLYLPASSRAGAQSRCAPLRLAAAAAGKMAAAMEEAQQQEQYAAEEEAHSGAMPVELLQVGACVRSGAGSKAWRATRAGAHYARLSREHGLCPRPR